MAQTIHLVSFGPFLIVADFPVPVLRKLQPYIYRTSVRIYKKQNKIKKDSPMAQTTPNASFGPVFVDPAQSVAYFVIKTYRYSKHLVSIEKEKKEKLT